MYIEKDLEKIKKLGKKNANDNFKFRSFLKSIDLTSKKIDTIVHRIYNEVIQKIDCRECANCCIEMKPAFDDKDIKLFIRSLDLSVDDFKKKYLEEFDSDEGIKKYEFNVLPCPFLKNKLCSNYENRPNDCRSFPHLHKKDFTSRLWGVIDNYSRCPIVFNVFEVLKCELRRNREY